MNDNGTTVHKIIEDKTDYEGLNANIRLEADIQVAFLNMLHEQGVLTDNVHSIALSKTIKGGI